MTEPNPVGEPAVNQDPVGGGETKPTAPAQPFKAFATEEDLKAFVAAKTEAWERKLAQLRKENEALKQSTMSEAEQAAEAERLRSEESHKKALEAAERRADIKALLMARGLNRDQANAWAAMAGDEWEDPEEAVKDLQGRLGVSLQQKSQPVAGGGGRNPGNQDIAYTPEYVSEMMAKHGVQWYTPEIRKKADEYRASHFSHGPRRLGT